MRKQKPRQQETHFEHTTPHQFGRLCPRCNAQPASWRPCPSLTQRWRYYDANTLIRQEKLNGSHHKSPSILRINREHKSWCPFKSHRCLAGLPVLIFPQERARRYGSRFNCPWTSKVSRHRDTPTLVVAKWTSKQRFPMETKSNYFASMTEIWTGKTNINSNSQSRCLREQSLMSDCFMTTQTTIRKIPILRLNASCGPGNPPTKWAALHFMPLQRTNRIAPPLKRAYVSI